METIGDSDLTYILIDNTFYNSNPVVVVNKSHLLMVLLSVLLIHVLIMLILLLSMVQG